MNRKLISLILAAIMVLGTVSVMSACQNEGGNGTTESITGNVTEESTSDSGEQTTDGNATNEATTEENSEITTDITDDDLYENGGEVKGAGFEWDKDAFALVEHPIDEGGWIDISAAELKPMLTSKALKAGEVYVVTDQLVLDADTKYYGNGAAIIAQNGILIKDSAEVVLKDIIIEGDIKLENADGITLFKVDLTGKIEADKDCYDVAIKSCRIYHKDVAIKSDAGLLSVFESYIMAENALVLTGDGIAVQDCHVVAVSEGISASGDSLTVKDNLVEVGASGTGIEINEDASNVLVALNIVKNAQNSISVKGGFNCVVLLNSAINVIGEDNTNLYVVENNLGGRVIVRNNNYLLCDANKYVADAKNHSVIDENNDNTNGDTLMDVNARPNVGANEELLPHTNKDLFVGMDRKAKVRDIANVKTYSLNNYIRNNAKENSVVIVPPGAYSSNVPISLAEAHKNTTVYAYGVYEEYPNYSGLLNINSTSNISIHGLTMGYSLQSAGQVHVIEKLGDLTVRVVTAAGYVNDFGKSNPELFSTSMTDVFKDNKIYPEAQLGGSYTIEHATDVPGTMILKFTGANAMQTYLETKVGEIYGCRIAGDNKHTISIVNAQNIKFKDVVLYGYAAALAVVAQGTSSGVSFERWHNTVHSGYVIDKETYDQYVAWEKEYGVDLEVYVDDNGNYRGSTPRVGSVDATHIVGSKEGVDVTSSILESMCDDGSNQRASSGRLHNYQINEEKGTVTLFFKNSLSTYYKSAGNTRGGICSLFHQGDRIFVYTAKGATVCDTVAASDCEYYHTISYVEKFQGADQTYSAVIYKVDIALDKFNESALAGFDLSDNSTDIEKKVLVDNLSYNSSGFTFDNVLIRNTRSRGILVKTVDVTIRHCTFRDFGMTGVLLSNEQGVWNESTVARSVAIQNCLFDHIGFMSQNYTNKTYAAISIQNLSKKVGEDYLPIDNVLIEGCEFRNNLNRFAIYVNSAKNVKILNNTFGEIVGESKFNPGVAVDIDMAMNVEISGNSYNYKLTSNPIELIKAVNCVNIFGKDVTDADGNRLIPDKLPEDQQ